MYQWRKLTDEQRKALLTYRQERQRPWHSPPHDTDHRHYHVTAANYEHSGIIGKSPQRLANFQEMLLKKLDQSGTTVFAWCVLPNHYHLLLEASEFKSVLKILGQLHGRTSHQWNKEDSLVGRKVWHRCADRYIRSARHFATTRNYVHNNPVHHNYVTRWQDWPFSSALSFIQSVGRNEARRLWNEYPLRVYGSGWDEKDM